jgi:hypothetical protein
VSNRRRLVVKNQSKQAINPNVRNAGGETQCPHCRTYSVAYMDAEDFAEHMTLAGFDPAIALDDPPGFRRVVLPGIGPAFWWCHFCSNGGVLGNRA